MRNLLFVVIITLLSACASTKKDFFFDGSSIATTAQGIAKVNKHLNNADKIEFFIALMAIQFSDVNSVTEALGDPTMMNEINYFIIGKKIDGLNYYGVLALAKSSQTKVRRVVQ
jgi:hypothetical protein